MDINKARQHFVNKEEEIANTYMSAAGDNGVSDTEIQGGYMTLEGHKNRVLFKGIILVAIIIGGIVLLRKQKK